MRALAPGLAALVCLTASHAGAYVFVVSDTTGEPIRWEESCIEIYLNPNVVPELVPHQALAALNEAIRPWNEVGCAGIAFAMRGATCFDESGAEAWPGTQNVVIWRDGIGSWEHPERVVALTFVSYEPVSARIFDADIEINGEDYSFGIQGQPGLYDLQSTLTHEFGHVLGLDHSNDLEATMYKQSFAGETKKRTLAADDKEALCMSHAAAADDPVPLCEDVPPAPLSAPFCPAEPDTGCTAGGGDAGPALFLCALLALAGFGRRRRRTCASIAVALFTGALSIQAAPNAQAYVPHVTNDGVPLRWFTTPVGYRIASDFPANLTIEGVEQAMKVATDAWDSLDCSPLGFRFDGLIDTPEQTGADKVNTVMWVHDPQAWNAKYGEFEVARTVLTFSQATGELTDADIEINAGTFTFSESDACAPEDFDLRSTLTHEIGHVVGINHSRDTTATMAAIANAGECNKRTLTQDDVDGFCASYDIDVPIAEPADATGTDATPDAADGQMQAPGDPANDCGAAAGRPGLAFTLLVLCALVSSRRRRRTLPRVPAR